MHLDSDSPHLTPLSRVLRKIGDHEQVIRDWEKRCAIVKSWMLRGARARARGGAIADDASVEAPGGEIAYGATAGAPGATAGAPGSPVPAARAAWQVEADRRASDKIGDSNLVVLVFPNLGDKGALTLTDEEVQRLVQGKYLNDTLIDYQLKQIQASLSPALLERCHFFTSHFFKRMMWSKRGNQQLNDPAPLAEAYKTVRRWTKHVDLFTKDFIFVPIGEYLHWSLAIIHRPGAFLLPREARPGSEPCIMYLDSMGGTKPKAFRLLKIYLDLVRKDKEAAKRKNEEMGCMEKEAKRQKTDAKRKDEAEEIDEPLLGEVRGARGDASGSVDPTEDVHEDSGGFDKMPEYDIKVPCQNNGVDCGLFMLQYVSQVAHRQPDLARAREWRWEDAECQDGGKLGNKDLSPQAIKKMRDDMYRTIIALGKEQQAKKKAKSDEAAHETIYLKRKRETKLIGSPEGKERDSEPSEHYNIDVSHFNIRNFDSDEFDEFDDAPLSTPIGCMPGLANLGNTCYLNATLQCLAVAKQFAERLAELCQLRQNLEDMVLAPAERDSTAGATSSLQEGGDDTATDGAMPAARAEAGPSSTAMPPRPPASSTQRLPSLSLAAAALPLLAPRESTTSDRSIERAGHFKQVLGDRFPIFKGFAQRDAHEFLCATFEGLEEEAKACKEAKACPRASRTPSPPVTPSPPGAPEVESAPESGVYCVSAKAGHATARAKDDGIRIMNLDENDMDCDAAEMDHDADAGIMDHAGIMDLQAAAEAAEVAAAAGPTEVVEVAAAAGAPGVVAEEAEAAMAAEAAEVVEAAELAAGAAGAATGAKFGRNSSCAPASESSSCPVEMSFGFRVRTSLRCTACGFASASVERFNHLSLNLPGGANGHDGGALALDTPADFVADAQDAQHALFSSSSDGGGGSAGKLHVSMLASLYFGDELRERRCERCSHESALASQRLLAPLPPNLMLHLKRFHTDPHTGIATKLTTRVRVDERLSLAPLLETRQHEQKVVGTAMPDGPGAVDTESGDGDGDQDPDGADQDAEGADSTGGATFRMCALVSHHGEHLGGGHYTCTARVGEIDQWACYDDSHVSLLCDNPTRTEAVLRGAYLLLYERIDACAPAANAPAASVRPLPPIPNRLPRSPGAGQYPLPLGLPQPRSLLASHHSPPPPMLRTGPPPIGQTSRAPMPRKEPRPQPLRPIAFVSASMAMADEGEGGTAEENAAAPTKNPGAHRDWRLGQVPDALRDAVAAVDPEVAEPALAFFCLDGGHSGTRELVLKADGDMHEIVLKLDFEAKAWKRVRRKVKPS